MNDRKLIDAIRGGDETAIDHVMTKYAKLLWKIADTVLKNVASSYDVEECVADVFIYLWENPDRYDPSRGTLKTWLCIAARTKAIDRFRALTRHNMTNLDEILLADFADLAEGIAKEDVKQLLFSAIRALKEPEREILVRRYYYDQKPKDIAIALELTVKQVDNYLYRAKQKLRETISVQEVCV